MVTPKEFRLGAVSELIGMALIFIFYKWNLPFLAVSVINAMGEARTDYTGFREICLDSVKGNDWMDWVFPLVFILIILATVVKGFVSNKSTVVLFHSYSTGLMLVFALFFTIVPFLMAPAEAYGMEHSWAGAYLQRVRVTPCILVFPFGVYFAVTAFFSYKRLFRCYDECPKQVVRYAWPFAKKSWLERNYGKKTEIAKEQCPPQEQAAIDKAVERMTGKSDEELKDILANPNDYSKSFAAAADIVLRKRQEEMRQDTETATVETVDTEISNAESSVVKVSVAEPPVAEVPKDSLSAVNVSNDKPQAVAPADKGAEEVPTPSKSHKKYYIIGGASVAVVLLVLFFCLKGGETVETVINVPAVNEALYKGKIGKVKVQMHLMQEGDSLYGTYFYERNKQDIQLTGKVDGARYVINEFVDGKNTGTFDMEYDKYNGEMALNGTWSNGKKKLKAFLEEKAHRIIPSADPEHPFVGEWCAERSDSGWEFATLGLYNKDTYAGYGFLHIKVSGNYDSFSIDSVLQLKGNEAVVQASRSYGNAVYKYVLTYNPADRSLGIKMEDGSSVWIPLDDRSLEQQIADLESQYQVIEEPEYDSQTVVYEEDVPPPPPAPELIDIVEDDAPASDEEQEKEAERARLQAELSAELVRETAEEAINKIYDKAEVMPKYPGGQAALMRYLSQNVKYPKVSRESGTQGKVVVQFVVNTDGSITDVQVIRSVDIYLDTEALRVIRTMPRWEPGKVNGKPARVKYTVPIKFRLS